MGDKYVARMELGSVYSGGAQRCRDDLFVYPRLMLEVHEKDDGTVIAFAIPPPERETMQLVEALDLPTTTLQRAGHDVLTQRNEELVAENAALRHINEKLEEQNRELMDRLMSFTDMAMEVLHGERQTAGGGRSSSSSKKPRASKSTSSSNGTPTEG